MTSGRLMVDDLLSAMEQFEKAHIEPVQKVFIVHPSYYDEAKKLFDGTGVKVVKNQSMPAKDKNQPTESLKKISGYTF